MSCRYFKDNGNSVYVYTPGYKYNDLGKYRIVIHWNEKYQYPPMSIEHLDDIPSVIKALQQDEINFPPTLQLDLEKDSKLDTGNYYIYKSGYEVD